MATKVKRSLIKTFLNTAPGGAAVWALLGDGVTTGKINYNPKTAAETYITEDSATTTLESYAPVLPIEATAKKGDSVFDYIDALRKDRAVLSEAESEVVNVWLYQTPGLTVFPAEKQKCSIQVEDFGGEGGQAAKLNYTINFLGDPVLGIFKPAATAAFYPAPTLLTKLTTLVLGSGPLTPVFNPAILFYTISVPAATVTMASTLTDATIVQHDNIGGVVNQGAAAALTLGDNVLTVTVTHSGETIIYSILATRTV